MPLEALPRQLFDVWQPAGRLAVMMPSFSCNWQGDQCAGQGRVEVINLTMGKQRNEPVGGYLWNWSEPAGA